MWVIPSHEFLRLSELRPHEELLREGKLVRVDNSMQQIFYVSHEWTSSEHPDHSLSHLHTFQSILVRMLRGVLPETAPVFADAIRLPKNVSITPSQWQRLVKDSFVWIDFISMPQNRGDDYQKASRSVASYVDRSSHFFAVCPTVKSKGRDDVVYDYGSWMQSSACRFELFALLLTRHDHPPPIVRLVQTRACDDESLLLCLEGGNRPSA